MENVSDPASLLPANRIGNRYEPVSILGVGATSIVYLAKDTMLGGEPVALKLLHASMPEGSDARKRFLSEGRILLTLSHPHIVRAYGVGVHTDDDSERPYLVLEHVHGITLDRFFSDGELQIQAGMRMLRELASALDELHRKGLVHRDLKPSNIMVTDSGSIVLLDLGIARQAEAGTVQGSSAMMGTPLWMSPEQKRGEKADSKSDIYAFGLIAVGVLAALPAGYPPAFTDSDASRERALGSRIAKLQVSKELRSYLATLVTTDPLARPSSIAGVVPFLMSEHGQRSKAESIVRKGALAVAALLALVLVPLIIYLAILQLAGSLASAETHYSLLRAVALQPYSPVRTFLPPKSGTLWRVLATSSQSVLATSIKLGDEEIYEWLLAEDVYSTGDDSAISALRAATTAGDLPLVRKLLYTYRHSPEPVGADSPLFDALRIHRFDIAHTLLDALSAAPPSFPLSVRDQAFLVSQTDYATFQRIVELQYLSKFDSQRMFDVMTQASGSKDDLQKTRLLFDRKYYDIAETEKSSGLPTVYNFVNSGHGREIRSLLDAGLTPTVRFGKDMLIAGVIRQPKIASSLIIELLRKYRFDVRKKIEDLGPVHWAIRSLRPRVLEVLLEQGADPNELTKANEPPLSLVMNSGTPLHVFAEQCPEYLSFSECTGVASTPRQNATKAKMVKILLRAGANPHLGMDHTPFIRGLAAATGDLDLIEELERAELRLQPPLSILESALSQPAAGPPAEETR